MSTPRMFIAAGPPGGGKSSLFVLSRFADRVFNADDRAAELNGGSYENIPTSVRTVVNREFQEFVHANIRAGASFYVALDTVERHIERVMRRAARGGHSASERTLRKIHASSLGNLPTRTDSGQEWH